MRNLGPATDSRNLTVTREVVMLEIPRGDRGDQLRVLFTQATTAEGKAVAWHSIREFFRDGSGEMRPGKKGITIRGKELRAVADALAKAIDGGASQRQAAPTTQESRRSAPMPFGSDDADR